MKEFKRVLLSRSVIVILCITCVLSAVYELLEGGWNNAEEYNVIIEKYSELSAEECYAEIEAFREEYDIFWEDCDIYTGKFFNAKYEKQLRKSCEERYGPDYEAVIAEMDFSEETQERMVRTKSALDKLETQLEYLDSYPKYLDTVHENSKKGSMAIFAKNIYNKRNSLKTDEDYPNSADIQVKLTTVESFDSFVCGKFDSFCALILVIAIVLKFADEKKKGLRSLVYGCKNGRGRLALKRLLILFTGSVTGTALICLCHLFSCIYKYGSLPDLSLAVQSSSVFKHFVYELSFGQVLILTFAVKTAGVFITGLLFWLLMQGIRNYKFALIVSAVIIVVEYYCLYNIPDSFTLVFLRFINILAPLDPEQIFLKYLNINLFGYPVSGVLLTLISVGVFIAAATVSVILLADYQKPVKPAGDIPRFLRKIGNTFVRLRSRASLSEFEVRKSLIFQHGFIVTVILLVTVYCLGSAPYSDKTMYDSDMAIEAGGYSCEISEDVLEDIDATLAEVETYEDVKYKNDLLKSLKAFRTDAQSKYDEGRGIWLLNQAPYASLFGKGSYQRKWGMIAFSFTVLLCAGLFPFEKQSRMMPLLMTTVRGRRKNAWRKVALSLLSAVFVWAVMSGTEIYKTYEYFGNFFPTLQAPLISIDYFRESSTAMTIGQYGIIYYLQKLLCLIIVALACCAISLYAENVNKAVVYSAVILLFPGALSILDVPLAEYASFIRLWSPLEANNFSYVFCLALIPALVVFIMKKWTAVRY